MPQFRKKPVVVEAMQWPGHALGGVDAVLTFEDWFYGHGGSGRYVGQNLHVKTLEDGPNGEAKHVADPGDWIIRGVKGEFYPCKPDIFSSTYEAVDKPVHEDEAPVGTFRSAHAWQADVVAEDVKRIVRGQPPLQRKPEDEDGA